MAAREVQRGGASPSPNRGTRQESRRTRPRRRLILIGCPGLESFAHSRDAIHWTPREIHRLRPFRDEGGVLVLGDAGIGEFSPPSLLRRVPAPPWKILLCPVTHRPEALFHWAPVHRSISVTSRALLGPRVDEALLEPSRLPLGRDGWERLSRCPCGTCGERLRALDGLGRPEVGPWAASVNCPAREFREWSRAHQGAVPVEVAWRYIEAVETLEKEAGWTQEAVALSLGYSSAESLRRARVHRGRKGRSRARRRGGSEV